jgi:hypothetical protein
MLNGPGDPLQDIVTRLGNAWSPQVMRRNCEELLEYLSQKLHFRWVGDTSLDFVVGIARDDISRYPTQPGFMVLMQDLIADIHTDVARSEVRLRLQERLNEQIWGDR